VCVRWYADAQPRIATLRRAEYGNAVPTIVSRPRPELVAVANLLDDAVADFLKRRAGIAPDGEWEAPLEGLAISNLMIRNVEAAAVLARCDEVLAPAAWANARNVFDAATRILWLLHPADRFESEARWIALLMEYERFHRRMAVILEEDDAATSRTNFERAEVLREFHTAVAAKLPAGYEVPVRIPSSDQALRDLGVGGMYRLYIEGSQYMHAGMHATSAYLDRSRSIRVPTQSVGVVDWILPLRTCWICLQNAGRFVIGRLEANAEWVTEDLAPRVDGAFRRLAESGFSRDDSEGA
jgi:hypothetical protein